MGLKSAICGIVAFIAWVLQQFGVDFGADAQADVSEAILSIVQGLGMIAVLGAELWNKWKSRKKGLQLLSLGLACLLCLSGCALRGLEKHEQALIVSDQVSEAYLTLRENYISLYEAFPEHRQDCIKEKEEPVQTDSSFLLLFLEDDFILISQSKLAFCHIFNIL